MATGDCRNQPDKISLSDDMSTCSPKEPVDQNWGWDDVASELISRPWQFLSRGTRNFPAQCTVFMVQSTADGEWGYSIVNCIVKILRVVDEAEPPLLNSSFTESIFASLSLLNQSNQMFYSFTQYCHSSRLIFFAAPFQRGQLWSLGPFIVSLVSSRESQVDLSKVDDLSYTCTPNRIVNWKFYIAKIDSTCN